MDGIGDWISLAFNAFSAINQGQQQKQYYDYKAAQNDAQAQAEQELGVVRGNQVRKAGFYQRGQARAAYGASGVDVNSGSASVVDQFINASSEYDARNEELTGARRAQQLRTGAALERSTGSNSMTNSLLSTAGSILKDGWKIRQRNVADSGFRAPVEERSLADAVTIS